MTIHYLVNVSIPKPTIFHKVVIATRLRQWRSQDLELWWTQGVLGTEVPIGVKEHSPVRIWAPEARETYSLIQCTYSHAADERIFQTV